MTAGSKSQLKANDNRTGCVSRKFMLAGTAAWISALIIFSAGHTLNNIEHVHLLKATLAFKELVATNICRRADAEPSTPPLSMPDQLEVHKIPKIPISQRHIPAQGGAIVFQRGKMIFGDQTACRAQGQDGPLQRRSPGSPSTEPGEGTCACNVTVVEIEAT
jgi:hypothetical protein